MAAFPFGNEPFFNERVFHGPGQDIEVADNSAEYPRKEFPIPQMRQDHDGSFASCHDGLQYV